MDPGQIHLSANLFAGRHSTSSAMISILRPWFTLSTSILNNGCLLEWYIHWHGSRGWVWYSSCLSEFIFCAQFFTEDEVKVTGSSISDAYTLTESQIYIKQGSICLIFSVSRSDLEFWSFNQESGHYCGWCKVCPVIGRGSYSARVNTRGLRALREV